VHGVKIAASGPGRNQPKAALTKGNRCIRQGRPQSSRHGLLDLDSLRDATRADYLFHPLQRSQQPNEIPPSNLDSRSAIKAAASGAPNRCGRPPVITASTETRLRQRTEHIAMAGYTLAHRCGQRLQEPSSNENSRKAGTGLSEQKKKCTLHIPPRRTDPAPKASRGTCLGKPRRGGRSLRPGPNAFIPTMGAELAWRLTPPLPPATSSHQLQHGIAGLSLSGIVS